MGQSKERSEHWFPVRGNPYKTVSSLGLYSKILWLKLWLKRRGKPLQVAHSKAKFLKVHSHKAQLQSLAIAEPVKSKKLGSEHAKGLQSVTPWAVGFRPHFELLEREGRI